MEPNRRRHPSYADVTATLALFVALGGTSYAALNLTGKDVKNGSLTGLDLKDGSVGGADLKTGSVTGADLKDGSIGVADLVAAARGAAGPAGPPGAPGPPGAEGKAGADGKPGADATKLWAVVNGDGTLRRGSGVISSERIAPMGNTYYEIKFNRDVSNCAQIGSLTASQVPQSQKGMIAVDRAISPTIKVDTVTVQTFADDGGITATNNKDFQVAVLC